VDFGLGMLNAFHLGDVIQDMNYQIRPFEVNKGETNKVFREASTSCNILRDRAPFEIMNGFRMEPRLS
jgi:predicted nucleotide-binding protein (sugar kinase/HSP70/actin superfamily)